MLSTKEERDNVMWIIKEKHRNHVVFDQKRPAEFWAEALLSVWGLEGLCVPLSVKETGLSWVFEWLSYWTAVEKENQTSSNVFGKKMEFVT